MNYQSVSGVIIDKCLEHGVWLDGGELQQLFEWKEVGGELRAKTTRSKRVQNERAIKSMKKSSEIEREEICTETS